MTAPSVSASKPVATQSPTAILEALANDQLLPYFQPLIDPADQHVIGCEALARWKHPEQGLLPPAAFVPVMADKGMMKELTELMLEKSLYACSNWRDLGFDIKVGVNLSTTALAVPNLAQRLAQRARIAGVPTANLVIELNSEGLLDTLEQSRPVLHELRSSGFGIAVDEFTPGSPMEEQLDPDLFSSVKLSRKVTASLARQPETHAALRHTAELAQQRQLRLIALGLEDKNDLPLLCSLGCNGIQGYAISRPLPESSFISWISEWVSG